MNTSDLAARLSLKRLHNGSWRGACPACAYPGTFSLREREGRTLWACASCQDRDSLTQAVLDAADGLWEPPSLHRPPEREGLSTARKTALAMAMWSEALPIEGTPAEAYLRARLVLTPWQSCLLPEQGAQLRFLPRARHPEVEGLHPAMLALVRRATDGEPVAVHRTYLQPDGSGKADLVPAKASFGPVAGGVVMLHAVPTFGPLILSEGIETALAASTLLGAPAWAAISAGNLERLELPRSARTVLVAADADMPGQRAAWAAAHRWEAEGRNVKVAMPDSAATDFNDILRAQGAKTSEAAHG